MQHGDDLEDDFVLDDLVAMSEEEEDLPETEEIGELLSADEDGGDGQSGQAQSAAAAEKKRKRRAKEKERKAKASFLNPCVLVFISRRPLPVEAEVGGNYRTCRASLSVRTTVCHACRLHHVNASKDFL